MNEFTTVTDIHGNQNSVRDESHRVDTRYCLTTGDAVWCLRVTHRVYVPARGVYLSRHARRMPQVRRRAQDRGGDTRHRASGLSQICG